MSSAEFINKVGFDDAGRAIMVNFTLNTLNETTGAASSAVVTVPMLALVPIPFLRVRHPVLLLVCARVGLCVHALLILCPSVPVLRACR